MRVASLITACMVLLSACQKRQADFVLGVRSPIGNRVATFRGYQPRGISKGVVVLTFRQGNQISSESSVFQEIENAEIGWLSNDSVAIIADQMKYSDIDSDYFPDGTVDSRVRLVICEREHMDCSSLNKRLQAAQPLHHITSFPES